MEKQWLIKETVTTETPINREDVVKIFGDIAVENYEKYARKLLQVKKKTRSVKMTKVYTNKRELEIKHR
ncbi:hypothetical protein NE172_03590 [Clostridium botulinum]|uniref:Uncharacterized protein n=1 Tax=Clostridium botulinum TaxID=1491 RepID=A0A6B4JJN0_CLOBO|nr:hypothetical protein [Clostridium botulinum]EES49131.1 conserved hypothetical protein [Clostridium botulinum E1 str. 'BoNT E Beluga']MBY6760243.1 hypothetical protein [Clostridium botulinum]MBY6919150.1 hypothetical protein [Clostridium botulinum]MCR1130024.1 hypothetical protein [Clostridium botulinum]NFJ57208.1 hypothetical protein [Clostridium botulinum]